MTTEKYTHPRDAVDRESPSRATGAIGGSRLRVRQEAARSPPFGGQQPAADQDDEDHNVDTQQQLATFGASYTAETGRPLPEDRFAFGDEPAMADELAALVLAGTKRATAALLADLGHRDDALPQVGDLAVVLDGARRPVCVIETTQVAVVAFDEVDATFAWDEGEGDRTLRYWRAEHERFFRARCDALGIEFTPRLEVVCERFEMFWTPEGPSTRGARP